MATYAQELQQQWDDALGDLARNDLDHDTLNSKLNRTERYSNNWYLILEQLNNNEKKRQMIASKLAFLRIELSKIQNHLSVGKRY